MDKGFYPVIYKMNFCDFICYPVLDMGEERYAYITNGFLYNVIFCNSKPIICLAKNYIYKKIVIGEFVIMNSEGKPTDSLIYFGNDDLFAQKDTEIVTLGQQPTQMTKMGMAQLTGRRVARARASLSVHTKKIRKLEKEKTRLQESIKGFAAVHNLLK